MSIKSVVILITDSYPYGDGENSFLTEELKEFENRGTRVLLLPLCTKGSLTKVSKNCEVISCKDEPISIWELARYFLFRSLAVFGDLSNPNISQTLRYVRNFLRDSLRSLNDYKQFKKAFNRVKDNEKIILYHYWSHQALWLSSYVQKYLNIKGLRISRAHGYDLFPCRSVMPLRVSGWNTMNSIFPVSNAGCEVVKTLSSKSVKIEVKRLGVPPKTQRVKVRGELVPIRLLVIAYFVPVKRLHLIVESVHHCNVPCELYFIGEGPEHDRIAEAALHLPHYQKLVFLGKMSNIDVINKIFEINPDLLVSSSYSEGVPVSMMEALSCGLPVASANVGGVSDLVNSENGWLLPSEANDYKLGLIEVLYQLLNESVEAREARSLACVELFEKYWNSNKNYAEFVDQLLNE